MQGVAYPSYGTYGIQNAADGPMMYDPAMNGNGKFRARKSGPSLAGYIGMCFFIPSLIFAVVYSMTCSEAHYKNAGLVQAVCVLMLVVAVALFVPAFTAIRTRGESGNPFWYMFLFASGIVAWLVGTALGGKNYLTNVLPYMEIQQLNIYPSINPAVAKGQALMDAGRITFVENAHLDLTKSMGFRSVDTYCVAPVAIGNQTLDTYDFWAVGIGCCSGHGPDFACGEFNNKHARSGLRLMKEDQRNYFRLAVQQAEATYNIKAVHPLFIYWMQDPQIEVQSYKDDAVSFTFLGLFGFFAAQLVCVFLAAPIALYMAPDA